MKLLGLAFGRGLFKLCRGQIDPMRTRIDTHGYCTGKALALINMPRWLELSLCLTLIVAKSTEVC